MTAGWGFDRCWRTDRLECEQHARAVGELLRVGVAIPLAHLGEDGVRVLAVRDEPHRDRVRRHALARQHGRRVLLDNARRVAVRQLVRAPLLQLAHLRRRLDALGVARLGRLRAAAVADERRVLEVGAHRADRQLRGVGEESADVVVPAAAVALALDKVVVVLLLLGLPLDLGERVGVQALVELPQRRQQLPRVQLAEARRAQLDAAAQVAVGVVLGPVADLLVAARAAQLRQHKRQVDLEAAGACNLALVRLDVEDALARVAALARPRLHRPRAGCVVRITVAYEPHVARAVVVHRRHDANVGAIGPLRRRDRGFV
eukprot:4965847-Prymnesium_polylepis.1